MNLFERFEVLEDPRCNIGKRYRLIDILIMTIYGILNKHEDFVNISYYLKLKEDYFVELLNLETKKIPSHDCLSDVFARINPKKFMEIFIEWTKDLVKDKTGGILNIDGKAVRDATDKINNGNVPYIVSAYLAEIGISMGQVKVDSKSNEMTAIPELLDLIDISGCTITMDAEGTYSSIAKKIIEKEGHFCLKVKGNQKNLQDEIQTYFKLEDDYLKFSTDYEKNHGRIEQRKYGLSYEVEGISNPEWDMVKAIGEVEVYREINKKITKEKSYYIMDQQVSMEEFIKITRSHWGIECGLHWVLDVIYNEDASRNREIHSIHNLSLIRKIVFNLVKLDKTFGEVPTNRKLTNYQINHKHIENLIFNIIPSSA